MAGVARERARRDVLIEGLIGLVSAKYPMDFCPTKRFMAVV